MLGGKNYSQEELDHGKVAFEEQLAAYKELVGESVVFCSLQEALFSNQPGAQFFYPYTKNLTLRHLVSWFPTFSLYPKLRLITHLTDHHA